MLNASAFMWRRSRRLFKLKTHKYMKWIQLIIDAGLYVNFIETLVEDPHHNSSF
jgi:hypothetical protein